MTKALSWAKNNKLATGLIVILILFIVKKSVVSQPIPLVGRGSVGMQSATSEMAYPAMDSKMGISPPYQPDVAPTTGVNRMVVKDTSLSLKVDNVSEVVKKIDQSATALGGYLVDSNVSIPEGASSGSISVRVPTEKREEALTQFRSFGVKTVSEYVSGRDVTDQYVDNAERLRILETTKEKFEAILADAKSVSDMLSVQRELLNVQQQIDSIKGQQAYLDGSTKLSKITVFLSTDELALPYAPDNSWRPGVVFKEAVRSLVFTVREFLSAAIWIVVFFPLWGIGLAVLYVIGKKMKMY